MSLPLKTLLFLLGVFWSFSLFGQTPVETYDSTKAYSIGALVLVGEESYIATAESTGKNPPDNTDVWSNLSVAASNLGIPQEVVPSLTTSEILASLPGSEPPGSDGNSSGAIQIFSISTRAFFGANGMSASLNLGGSSEAKKVMFRTKGPSMNLNGPKLADPWIDVYSRPASGGTWNPEVKSYSFGDHSSSTGPYANRATGNNVEPMIVTSLTPSIYSCVVGSENGGTGNAIVEIYSMDDDTSKSFFYSLSTRGYFSTNGMSGSVRLVGTGTKKVMFRVKGPSMNISGTKLADPNLTLYHKTSSGWVEVVKSSTFGAPYTSENSSYTNVTSSYASRHTGNNLEPMLVFDLSEGTYSCVIGSDNGGEGNAILEIYQID